MIQQQLEPYRDLISVLLTYPDRAHKVLKNNQNLIDNNLLQLLQELSEKMSVSGNKQAAEFLLNLANHIRQEFCNNILQVGKELISAKELLPRMVKYQMLPKFLSEVIIDQAIAPIICSPEEINNACQNLYQQYQITDEKERQQWCQHNGLTAKDLEEIAVRPVKIYKFQQENWGRQVERLFLERKKQLDQICYSVIRLKNYGLAQELFFRIQDKEQSFAEVAKQFYSSAEAKNNGVIGPIAVSTVDPLIARILFASKPGELLPPRKIEEYFLILRLEKIIPARLDEAMHRRLLNELFNTWLSEEINRNTKILQSSINEIQGNPSPTAALLNSASESGN